MREKRLKTIEKQGAIGNKSGPNVKEIGSSPCLILDFWMVEVEWMELRKLGKYMVNPHGDGNDLDFVDVPQFQVQLGSGLGSCALGAFPLSYSQGFLGQT